VLLLAAVTGCSNGNNDPGANNTTSIPAPAGARSLQPPDVAAPPAGVPLRFSEVSAASGVDFVRYDDIRGQHRLFEANGGGVAIIDFDNDLLPDLFFTNGCRLPRRKGDESHSNQLYRNSLAGSFSSVAEPAGVRHSGFFQGCTVGDFDNDGFDDLYIAAFGDNSFLHNQGDGTFRDITSQTRTQVNRWSSSPAFADLNGDGNLDLFVVTYVEAADDPPQLCPQPASRDGYVQCSPTIFPAAADVLFLNDGQGGFVDATALAGVAGIDGKGLGIAVFDADRDGRPDVFIANDGTPNFLYMNQGNASDRLDGLEVPRFVDKAFELGTAVNSHGKAQAGMGVAVADVDGDGLPDIFVTNFYAEANSLYRNLGLPGFEDATNSSGLGPPSRQSLGFGAAFFDPDNDGWPDLLVTNGHVDDRSSYSDVPYRMPPLLFRSERNGRYSDVTRGAGPYFQGRWLGRGLAVADLDADGDQDVVISQQLAPSAVLRNETPSTAASVSLQLVGRGNSNRSAFHATVQLAGLACPLSREVIGGGSFQSASDRAIHIGLGTQSLLPRLEVRWPDGATEAYSDVPPGSYIVVQGQGLIVRKTSSRN
jgi:hypothetical protein